MNCKRCGGFINPGNKFCMTCGAAVEEVAPTQTDFNNGMQQTQNVNPTYQQPLNNNYEQPVNNYQQPVNNYQQPINNYQQPVNNYNQSNMNYNNSNGNNDNKALKVLAYCGFLTFIPLLSKDKNNPSVKFHTGQGLLCLILDVLVYIIDNFVIFNVFKEEMTVFGFGTGVYQISSTGYLLAFLVGVPAFILSLIGIMNAVKGKDVELPVIGKFAFYK